MPSDTLSSYPGKPFAPQDLQGICCFYTITILLLPIVSIYASPIESVSIGELFLFFVMLVLLFDNTKKLGIKKNPFLIYVSYASMITLICCFLFMAISENYSVVDSLKRMFRDAFYFTLILVFSPRYFDFRYGKSVIGQIACITGFFVVLQFVAYSLLGVYISGIIPWLKTTISGGLTGSELAAKFASTAESDGFARGTGFFSEPAVVAQFMSVALLLELFPVKDSFSFKKPFFYTVTLILTFSVNAYVSLLVCWSLWALCSSKKKKARVSLICLLVLIGILIAMSNEKTASVLKRLVELKNGERTSGSSVLRVVRGMAFYSEMPFFYQVFGSGFGNFIQFKALYSITTVYEEAAEYMNTNAYVLVSSGAIGFVLYLFALFGSSKGRVMVSAMIAIVVFMFGISSSIYSSPVFVIMLSFLMAAPKKEDVYEA